MNPTTKKVLQYTITFVTQIVLIILYTVIGALVFRACELPGEKIRRDEFIAETTNNRERTIALIHNVTGKYFYTNREIWANDVSRIIRRMERRMGVNVAEMKNEEYGWSFSGALFFSATVITTIGYGNIAPVTTAGRIFCMAYAIFGIALLLLVLASIGSLFARGATLTYRMLHDKMGPITIGKRKKTQEEQQNEETYYGHNGTVSSQDPNRDKVIHDIWGTIRFDKNGKMIMPDDPDIPPPTTDKTKDSDALGANLVDSNHKSEESRQLQPPRYPDDSSREVEEGEVEKTFGFGAIHDDEEEVDVPIYVGLLLSSIYIVLLAAMLLLWEEEWSFFDALYFSFVTLTTIGFGDLVPEKNNVFACTFFIILGMAILSMCIALAQESFMRKIDWLGTKVGVALLKSKEDGNTTKK